MLLPLVVAADVVSAPLPPRCGPATGFVGTICIPQTSGKHPVMILLGDSRGGEFALLAASTYPQIHAVIASVPSPFAWAGARRSTVRCCS